MLENIKLEPHQWRLLQTSPLRPGLAPLSGTSARDSGLAAAVRHPEGRGPAGLKRSRPLSSQHQRNTAQDSSPTRTSEGSGQHPASVLGLVVHAQAIITGTSIVWESRSFKMGCQKSPDIFFPYVFLCKSAVS